jgi:pimeloyl-ACP methyl ester carboxylesterase
MNLEVDGILTHIERVGEGRPVLLLHGWGPASVTLDKHLLPLARQLQGQYEVTMLEFPGHGASGLPGDTWGVAEFAAWTLKAMDQLALKKPVIVAHSFGGRVALHLAAHHPDRVSSLVLTGCAGLRPRRSLKGWVRTRIFQAGRLGIQALGLIPAIADKSKDWLASLRLAFSSQDYLATPETLRGSFSQIVRQDLRPLLPDIQQQTLLVWGELDSATPLWMGQAMAREMPHARLLVYVGDDHFAYHNQVARFANAVDTFLQEVHPA